jgi:hypothetical protein
MFILFSLLGNGSKNLSIVAGQGLGKNVTATMNTQATVEELLDE